MIKLVQQLMGRKKRETIVREFYAIGTVIKLRAYGNNGEKAIQEAMKRVNDIDDKMSVFKDNSDISMINKKAGISSQQVGEDTYFVIKRAVEYSKLLEGTFDPTIRPIVSLWRIGSDNPRIPGKNDIARNLKLVNYEDVILNEEDNSIGLRHVNQAIDVGGIAKGYAADEVKRIFENYKIKSALIDLGGNIFALGKKLIILYGRLEFKILLIIVESM